MTPTPEDCPKLLRRAVKSWAVVVGCGLVLAALITVLSVAGRALAPLGLHAISGDFELIELATGIAVFGFLGFAHMEGKHVSVGVLVDRFPPRTRAFLSGVSEILMAIVSGILLWRLYLGFAEKFPYGPEGFRSVLAMGSKPYFAETTYELQIEIWIPYALCLVGAALFFAVAMVRAIQSLKRGDA